MGVSAGECHVVATTGESPLQQKVVASVAAVLSVAFALLVVQVGLQVVVGGAPTHLGARFVAVEGAGFELGAKVAAVGERTGAQDDNATEGGSVEGGGGSFEDFNALEGADFQVFDDGGAVAGGQGNVVEIGFDPVGGVGGATAHAAQGEACGGAGGGLHLEARDFLQEGLDVGLGTGTELFGAEVAEAAGGGTETAAKGGGAYGNGFQLPAFELGLGKTVGRCQGSIRSPPGHGDRGDSGKIKCEQEWAERLPHRLLGKGTQAVNYAGIFNCYV